MKKLLALALSALLLFFAAPARAVEKTDIENMSAEDLLALRDDVNARLRELGAYPFTALKRGVKGEDVTALQNRLTELGYYAKAVNGSYDTNTANAQKAFEKANGLKQDGAASADDQRALFGQSALAKPTPAPSPTPKPTATPNRSKAYPPMDYRAAGLTPDAFTGKKMSLTGTVLQALSDGADGWRLRVATDGENGNVVYVTAPALSFEPAKGNQIACYGTFAGLYTYQTKEGKTVVLPALSSEITEKIS